MTTPLQLGVPGGPELLVIFLVAVILLGVPLLVLLGVASGLSILGADEEEIEELQRRVAELEAQIAEKNAQRYEDDERD